MFRFKIGCLLAATLFVVACGDDDSSGNNANNENNVNNVNNSNNSNNLNNVNNVEDMGMEDMAPVDSDGDMVLDDVDNCVDVANPEQADRDRDGVGDACDNFVVIHDPENPTEVTTIVEADEDNDEPILGEQYDVSVDGGFVLQGSVTAPENGVGDTDFYSFEITQPTALIIRVEGSDALWPAAIVAGYDFRNANITRIGFGADAGMADTRELFLPVPGRYTVAVSDFRNFVGSAADVGGDEFTYNVSVSAIPLPQADEISLPAGAIPKTYDGQLHVYRVDTQGIDAIEAQATGIGLDMNSFYAPAVTFLEEDLSQSIGFTSVGQVSDTNAVSLRAVVGDRDSVLVIEEHIQKFQSVSSSIQISQTDLADEPETPQTPLDDRTTNLVWLAAGTSINAEIGPPRASGPTTLDEDRDYFLFTAKRGQSVRVTVTPDAGSAFVPYLEVGPFIDQQGSSYLNADFRSEEVRMDGTGIIEFTYTSFEDGEAAIYIQHLDNRFTSNPVGGPNYGYTVDLELFDPAPTNVGSIPAMGTMEIESGEIGILAFDAQAGEIVNITSDTDLFVDSRVYSATDYSLLAQSDEQAVVQIPEAGTYWFDMRDLFGRPTDPNEPITVVFSTASIEDFGTLPGTKTGLVDVAGKTAYYRISGDADDIFDIRVAAANFLPDIKVYNSEFQQVTSTLSRRTQLRLNEPGEFIVSVTGYNGAFGSDYNWTLGIQKVAATPIAQLPANISDAIDSPAFADWFVMDVTQGTSYSINLGDNVPAFNPTIYVYNAETLGYVDNGTSTARWTSNFDGQVFVNIFDSQQGGDPSWMYDLSVAEISLTPIVTNQSTSGTLATAGTERLYEFDVTSGLIDVRVDPVGDWRPRLSLINASSLGDVAEAGVVGNTIRYAVSTPGSYAVSVAVDSAAGGAPYDFNIVVGVVDPAGSPADTEPNDTQGQAQQISTFPTIFSATIGNPDLEDRFAVDLIAGQRVWAMTSDSAGAGIYSFSGRIRVHAPDDTPLDSDTFSGEGFFPAFYGWEAPASGRYNISVSPTNMSFSGAYYLFLSRSEATTFSETEPNNTSANANVVPSSPVVSVSASVDTVDTSDVFQISIAKSGTTFNAFLENAADGHELRLLDNSFQPLVESGDSFDGLPQPTIQATLSAGVYYVEFRRGTTDGTADLILQAP